MTRDEIVETLKREVPALVAVYLFGSEARGEAIPGSDLDLAFLSSARIDPVARFELQEKLAARIGRDVDLVELRSAPAVLRVQVIDRGMLVHESDRGARAQFEAEALADYARLNEERRGILDDVRQRGSVHG